MGPENLDINSDQVTTLTEPYQYAAGDFHNLSGRTDEIADIPEEAVVDPSIPPDSCGAWYRLPDGAVLAHPTESAHPMDS